MKNYKSLLPQISTLIFDYDGVMTDGTIVLNNEGEPLRTAFVKDGYALQLAVKMGIRVAIISGGKSPSMEHRFHALGVPDVFLGVPVKIKVFEEYIHKYSLKPNEIMFMGDDLPDYQVMQQVGLPACPADAAEEIKEISLYISSKPGGRGCVRDIIEQVLKIQGKWLNQEGFSW